MLRITDDGVTVHDTHCREVHEMMAIDALKRMVNKKEETVGEDPIC